MKIHHRYFFLLVLTFWCLWLNSSANKIHSQKNDEIYSSKEVEQFDLTEAVVSFLLQNSDSDHLLVVTDGDFQELETAMSVNDQSVGVTFFSYTPGELKKYLHTFYHSSNSRKDILVTCAPNTTVSIFQEVNQERLETGYFRWFLLSDFPIDNQITPVIYEENQVVIFEGERKTGSRIVVKEAFWKDGNYARFENIGWVSSISSGFRRGFSKFPNLFEKYKDFDGRMLEVAANNHIVYFVQRTLENGEKAAWEGVDVNIVKLLSKVYNFTFQVRHPEDGRWGGPSADGSISGLIGLVAHHEANLAIHEITITETRESVVDFTKPYYTEGSTLVSKVPELKDLALAVVTPFSYPVWGLVIASLIVIGLTVMFIDMMFKRHIGKDQSLEENWFVDNYSYYLFNMFRNLVIQGNRIESHSSSLRVVLGLWFIICLIIYALYSGTLVAVYAAPSYMDPINSLVDLLKALRNDGVYPIATAGTAISFLFQRATFGTHQEIYHYFDPAISHAGYDERFSQAAKGKAVIMSSRLSNIIKTNIYGRDKYHIGTEAFYFQSYGIAVSTGSPFKLVFSKTLQRVIEAGLINAWVTEAVNNELRYIGISEGDRGNVLSRRTSSNKPISILQLQAAFFILAFGFLLAFIFLIFENVWCKCSRKP